MMKEKFLHKPTSVENSFSRDKDTMPSTDGYKKANPFSGQDLSNAVGIDISMGNYAATKNNEMRYILASDQSEDNSKKYASAAPVLG